MTKQTWRANQYSDHASFVSELGSPVVSLLNPIPGEHILDLGCGDGSLTEKIQRAGATVIGVDSSALESVGFYVSKIELTPRPTPLKTGIREWLNIFANYVMSTLDPEQQTRFLREVEDRVKTKLYSKKNGWSADYVRLRFCASKA